MKKFLIGTAIGLVAFAGAAPAAQATESHHRGYGVIVQDCLDKSVGAAIKAGKAAHEGARMTAKTIAESPHCAS
ncbi:hypothetical protein LKO27_05865 [Tessaracoccus sp. OS52]|uniref:hypothetical protein n=1 Tax=Tessaracoccus sp. OS52 TaxID=2886691 RepID=UPI001D107D81|nr:hypothetical protein [Tessaracoccus sp. OS52]MCC2592940.1 hypothetical protein [Tessaracoccus sp. OS52]